MIRHCQASLCDSSGIHHAVGVTNIIRRGWVGTLP